MVRQESRKFHGKDNMKRPIECFTGTKGAFIILQDQSEEEKEKKTHAINPKSPLKLLSCDSSEKSESVKAQKGE